MACICGWVSEEYPDTWMPIGLGGVLDCPICHSKLQNATLEGCYGSVTVITLEELQELYEQVGHGIEWEQAFRNLRRKKIGVLLTTPFNTVPPEEEEPDQDWGIYGEVEEDEDTLRKRKHKSIRVQGKYKGRGKTKRREP